MGNEGWPEWATSDPTLVRELYAGAAENLQLGLDVVARSAPARLTYADVEAELGWPRGRLGRAIGGWRSHLGSDARRPYHICPPELSRTGQWEIWMDRDQASALA